MLHIFTSSQQVQHGQNGFTPKKHSSLDANSEAGSLAKLCNFKTQHHHGSQTVVLDNLKFLILRDLLLQNKLQKPTTVPHYLQYTMERKI